MYLVEHKRIFEKKKNCLKILFTVRCFSFSLPLMASHTVILLLRTTQDLYAAEWVTKQKRCFVLAIPGPGGRTDDKAKFWGRDPTSSSLALPSRKHFKRMKVRALQKGKFKHPPYCFSRVEEGLWLREQEAGGRVQTEPIAPVFLLLRETNWLNYFI